jgi:hypothetical protein
MISNHWPFQLDALETGCLSIGRLWPQLFLGSTIKPKIDVLVFVVPTFARRWGTVGGVGEERVEALHQTYNVYARIYAPMRKRGEALVRAMKSEKIMKAVGNVSKPRKRVWKNRDPKFLPKKQRLE